MSLCVGGSVDRFSGNNIEELFDQLDEDELRGYFPDYDNDQGQFRVDVRGLPATLTFPDQGETRLVFSVPVLGIEEEFVGATRDDSNNLFEDYIEQEGDEILEALLRFWPVDPLAGNPSSLQSDMIQGDFDAGTSPGLDSLGKGGNFGVGLRFGRYSLDTFNSDVYTLPLSYVYVFDNNDKLILRLPIAYSDTEGASSYRITLGASFRKNIFRRWSLTPSLSYGAVGSSDLGSYGQIISGSLTSDFILYASDRMQVSMGNMGAVTKTLPLRYNDYDLDIDYTNQVLRNGFFFSFPMRRKLSGMQISTDVFVVDTRFSGDELFVDNYQEIGITLGPARSADKLNPHVANNPIGIGLKYTHAPQDVSAFEVTFGYRF
jgi:hypothetical protein